MEDVYITAEISRQGHFQAIEREHNWQVKRELYSRFIYSVREVHPGMGLRAIYMQHRPEGIGRDAFIALGLSEGFRLRSVSNPTRTTYSVKSSRYKNLLVNKRVTDVNQVWVSDLFYFQVVSKHYYVVLIMDVYSRRIVGYDVADNMRAENTVKALRMALKMRGIKDYKSQLIHHSDRGSQYVSNMYTELLESYKICISMCANVLENAHCERANGTIKNDYLARKNIRNFPQLKKELNKSIWAYNFDRHHQSLPRMSPVNFETNFKELDAKKRPFVDIFTYSNQNSENNGQMQLDFGL